MVNKILTLIILCAGIMVLFQCPAGPPTGPSADIEHKTTLNCCLYNDIDTQQVWLSRWYKEFNPSSEYDTLLSVVGAKVIIMVDDTLIFADEIPITNIGDRYSYRCLSYYQFTGPFPRPGQNWTIQAFHPDLDSVSARTTIPFPVTFYALSTDTLAPTQNLLTFKWHVAEYAFGYLPRLFLIGEKKDGSLEKMELYPEYNAEKNFADEFGPIHETEVVCKIKTLLEEIRTYNFESINEYMCFWIQLEVYSLNDALYYAEHFDTPDPLVGISTPAQHYTNIINGGGYLGAYQKSVSSPLFLPKEILVKWIEKN